MGLIADSGVKKNLLFHDQLVVLEKDATEMWMLFRLLASVVEHPRSSISDFTLRLTARA